MAVCPPRKFFARTVSGQQYTLGYDAENRVVSVTGTSMSASFLYDGDGNRVKSIINGVSTDFIGNYYEVTPGAAVRKYYMAGASRVAMNVNGAIYYLFGDQLGSTSITTDAGGVKVSELRYKAWGEVRYSYTSPGTVTTDYTYTGQYSNMADFGLLFYNARWYDPALGRFAQADSVVPDGVQGWDRYAYVNNAPMNNTDPTGHRECEGAYTCSGNEHFPVRRIVYVGSFRAGLNAQTLGESAEENYTGGTGGGSIGPISGVSPMVPLLRGQTVYGLPDPSGAAGLLNNVAGMGSPPPGKNVSAYLAYSSADDIVTIDSLYISNRSDYKAFIMEVRFTAMGDRGQITESYNYSCDNCLPGPTKPYTAIVPPQTDMQIGLFGTSANPTNTFQHVTVMVKIVFRDPMAAFLYPTLNTPIIPIR